MATPPSTTIDLRLDDDSEPLEQPRRLVRVGKDWAAYGGDFGKVVALVPSSSASLEARVVRHSDDAIRAIAANPSGTRVAVGTDSGDVLVYAYPPESVPPPEDSSKLHPFLALPEASQSVASPSQSQDDFLVQRRETCWLGPPDSNPLRDLVWVDDSWLLVASESNWCWLDASTSERLATSRKLPPELDEAHGGGGIRSLAISESGGDLVSLGMDGRACFWTKRFNSNDHDGIPEEPTWELLCREDTKCVSRNDVGEVHGASPWCRSSRPVFVKHNLVALPGEPFLQLRRIAMRTVAKHDQPVNSGPDDLDAADSGGVRGHVEPIVTMASRDGYLVTCGRDGRVVLWNIIENRKEGTIRALFVRLLGEFDSAPTDVVWSVDARGEDVLWIVTANGQLVTIRGRDNIAPVRQSSSSADTVALNEKAPAAVANPSDPPHSPARLAHDDDEPFGGTSPTNKGEAESLTKPNRFIDDQAAEDDDDEDSLPPPASSARPAPRNSRQDEGDDSDGEDDGDYDDMNDLPYPPVSQLPAAYHQLLQKLPEPQAPFAPSSTPLDLPRRFLCWNHLGSITRLQGEPGLSRTSVDIDFTDSAFRRPVSFTDNLGFVLGSLGEDGGIFCTDVADDDSDAYLEGLNMSEATKEAVKKSQKSRMRDASSKKPTGSTIYFHRFESLGSLRDKDWHLTLPNDERVLGCACGEGWAAVATSRRFLRLFSSGGNQGQVVWLPGEPVTMAGRSRFLLVVYHSAAPLPDGTQQLSCTLMDAAAQRVLHQGPLSCVSKASSLTWIGFSNSHSAMALDSDGMLSMLVCVGPAADEDATKVPSTWEWVPMLDTVGLRKSHDDNFWPITVYDGKLVCVPLKGGTKYPDAARKPVTASLSCRLPLARGPMVQVNALEELAVRADITLTQKKVLHDIVSGTGDEEFDREYSALSAQVDKVLLKMFAGVVEAKKLDRALDLVDRLHLEKSYDLAMRIADNHHRLVDRIEEAKNLRFGAPGDFGFEPTAGADDSYDGGSEFLSRITPDSAFGRKRSLQGDDPNASIISRQRRG